MKTSVEKSAELALLALFEIASKLHQMVSAAVIAADKRGDSKFHSCRKKIRKLGQQLLALGGKPALEYAYFIPGSITTTEAQIIKEEWRKLGLKIDNYDFVLESWHYGQHRRK